MKSIALLVNLLIAVCAFSNDAIVGVWENPAGKAYIEIFKVKDRYFGKVIYMKQPTYDNGLPKVDKNNPDKNLQNAPLVGLIVLRDLQYDKEENTWSKGKIYNPDDGRAYNCQVKLKDNNTLSVRGFVGCLFLGKTVTMRRARV
jgi:uncharacterized protein (DUF2147 family)